MADLPEEKKWTGVYQWETSDRALAGPDTALTRPIRNLTDRTAYLKEQLATAQQSLTQHESSTNHPVATLTKQGFVQLSSALDSDSESHAATAKAVKAAYQLAKSKADGEHTHPFTVFSVNQQTGDVTVDSTAIFGPKAIPLLQRDLNTIRTPGIYYQNHDENTAIELNYPMTLSGSLTVLRGAEVTQIYRIYASSRCYIRSYYKSWSQWSQQYDQFNPPTAEAIGAASVLDTPVGTPQPWPSATPPSGWLKCNGAIFDPAQYPKLALAYPAGQLPDLRGEFIRGWDDGRGVDGERTIGSWQKGSVVVFDPTLSWVGVGTLINSDSERELMKQRSGYDVVNVSDYSGVYQTSSTGVKAIPLATEGWQAGSTRPRNISFLYIVRAA